MAHQGLTPKAGALALGLGLAGCGAPPQPATPPPAPTLVARAPAAPDFENTKTGEFRSKRFQITLPLPDGHAWRIDDHKGTWLAATHAATQSELSVRVWAEDGRANSRTCEEAARVWRKLPEREGAEVISSSDVASPAGFDTHADLLVITKAPGAKGPPEASPGTPIRAHVLAFGGHLHRCFAYVFSTTASGADAERVVGARLAAMLQRSLRKLTAVDELNPTPRSEPVPER